MAATGSSNKPSLGRVLVVDDDPALRKLCARVLGEDGWGVTIHDRPSSALEAVRDRHELYDCVVSDIRMPELDGFEFAAALRCHDPDLPVLLMTGDPSLDGAVRAIDSGAVCYLAKPFEPAQLAAGVARAARRQSVARMRRRADMASQLDDDHAALCKQFDHALATIWMAFQPIVDVAANRIYAYEALLRNEEDSLRRPDLLLAAAARLGRVHDLGRCVRAAVARAAPQAPTDALLFVNVHGLELADESLFDPSAPLSAIASRVVLEITEHTSIDEIATSTRVAMLRRLGFRVAVDDLGAGYAALGALATLEPEVVKLDMSLVRNVDQSPTKQRVITSITSLCRDLGSLVVAEGVETTAERTACTAAGVNLLQGYLFARPARHFAILAQ